MKFYIPPGNTSLKIMVSGIHDQIQNLNNSNIIFKRDFIKKFRSHSMTDQHFTIKKCRIYFIASITSLYSCCLFHKTNQCFTINIKK